MPFEPAVETVECDVLIVGGGMAGCGAAFEAANWARGRYTPVAPPPQLMTALALKTMTL